MRETGKVISTKNGRAEVEVAAKGECEHCSAHGVCNWTGTSVRKVMAVDRIGAVAGDAVELEIGEATGVRTNILVFGIPVLLMLAGVLVGGLVLRKDLWSGILTGIGLALGLGIVKMIDVAASRSGQGLPVIVGRAVEGEDQNSECRMQNGGEADEDDDGGGTGHAPGDGVR